MKAIIWTKYGSPDGLQLGDIAKPTPKDNEVLVRVHAATVTAGDCEVRRLKFPLLLGLAIRLYMGVIQPKNRILGQELAGEIEAVGGDVKRFKIGDPIFATTGFGLGAYAEYKCLPAQSEDIALALKPTNMTYEEAAAIPIGGLEALYFLRRASLQPGQHMLINGAGGSIGTVAVQLAKYYGAEVTAVDRTEKLDMLRAIGADHVVDYTREDFTKSGKTYDVIFDVVGKSSFSGSIRSLKPRGIYLLGNAGLAQMLRGRWVSILSGKKVVVGTGSQSTEDLMFLKNLAESGALKTIIDRRYPLAQTAEAHRYVETGKKMGNVIISVAS